jgi:hypothetical protein
MTVIGLNFPRHQCRYHHHRLRYARLRTGVKCHLRRLCAPSSCAGPKRKVRVLIQTKVVPFEADIFVLLERTEFEFLPPVKNVIALDDADSNVPDEPWEYISSAGGDDEARKIFSYAEIVSKSA